MKMKKKIIITKGTEEIQLIFKVKITKTNKNMIKKIKLENRNLH
jgi:hypothetical protein